METQVEQLDGDRVRLTVEIPADDVHHAVSHAASDLAANVKVPGFRKGKVPVPVLVSRLGKDRIYAEAVESHIGSWFWSAATNTNVQPADQPQYSYDLPESDGKPWSFTAEFPVQRKPEPADWTTLEVPKLEAEVPAEAVEETLHELQSSVAEIVPAAGRLAQAGDVAVVDLVSDSGAQRDVVLELGAERLVEEIESGIRDLAVGESRDVAYELADDERRTITITLKELREKVLPPLDDDLARAASEFETLDELQADIEGRMRSQLDDEIERRFRMAAVDALVEATDVQSAALVVDIRTRELANGFVRSLQARGIDLATYLQLTGTTPQALEQRLRAETEQAVARELVLEAVADKLALEVSDDEIRTQLREQGESDDVIETFIADGGADRARHDLRLNMAIDRIAAEVKPISQEDAEDRAGKQAARDKIWTPGEDSPAEEKKIWIPGSKE